MVMIKLYFLYLMSPYIKKNLFKFNVRKIEIVQFASRTRQLFVRLLALVKWANSATKVDKCAVSHTIVRD